MYKAKSKKGLLVEQEDGRRIRISCRETNLGEGKLEEVKVNQVSVRTLIPLAELIANMVVSQEDIIHEASIESKSINSSKWQHKPSHTFINLQPREQNQTNNAKDSIQELGTKSSTSVNPMPSSTHPANTKGRFSAKKGEKQ